MTTTNGVAPGWYADPQDATRYRWFDGQQWTEHVHAGTRQSAASAGYGAGAAAYGAVAQNVAAQNVTPQSVAAQSVAAQSVAAHNVTLGGCQQCGASPAQPVTLRSHRGMIFMQQFLTYRGTWCRDCGIARFRQVQKHLWTFGWWGYISAFVTAANTFQNLAVFFKLRSLGTPQGRRAAALPMTGTVFASAGFAIVLALVAALGWFGLR